MEASPQQGASQSSKTHSDEDKLEYVLSMFRNAKSDEQRFAMLLMMIKLAPSADSRLLQQQYASKIYESIGLRFLRRLLVSKKIPEGCPRDIYSSLAMHVLVVFVSVPSIAAAPEMLEVGDLVVDVLDPNEADDSFLPSEEAQVSAISVLAGIASVPDGRACLLKRGTDRVLCSLLNSNKSVECVAKAVIELLIRLVQDTDESGVLCGSARTVDAIIAIARCVAERNDTAKLTGLEALCTLLEVVTGLYRPDSATIRALSRHGTWTTVIGHALWNLLRNKLGSVQRDFALNLAALVTELTAGVEWLLQIATNPVSDVTGPKLLMLLVQIATVELRMSLEDRGLAAIELVAQRVVSCYMLVEYTIVWATNMDSSTEAHIGSESIAKILDRLRDCVGAATALILTLKSEGTSLEPNNSASTKMSLFLSSVRVIGSWYAEESSEMPEQGRMAIKFIIGLLNTSNFDKQYESALKWMLPSLCHVTANDVGRAVFLEAKGHQVLTKYFSQNWYPKCFEGVASEEDTEDLVQSMITCCGILLNLVVLAPNDFLGSDDTINTLCSFLLQAILSGRLQSTPLLNANSTVIVLRILLHNSNAVQSLQEQNRSSRLCRQMLLRMSSFLTGTIDKSLKQDTVEDVELLRNLATQALHVALRENCIDGLADTLGISKAASEAELISSLGRLN